LGGLKYIVCTQFSEFVVARGRHNAPSLAGGDIFLLLSRLVIVTSGHVRKMTVMPFDPPYLKTPRCTQTSRLYRPTCMIYRTGVIADRSFTLSE